MFAENLLVGFYWGRRAEGLDVCTDRVVSFLDRLSDLDPMFSNWFKDFGEDQPVMSKSKDRIRELLLAGQTYPDVGDKPMKDSGYRVTLYNQPKASSFVKLSLQCDEIHPKISNLCLIQAIAGTLAHAQLARISLLMDLCRLIIDCWQPDRGIVSCHDLKEVIVPETMGSNCGWFMYHKSANAHLPTLPDTAKVEVIPNRGNLVIASEDLTIPPTPQAIEDVRAAFEALKSAR